MRDVGFGAALWLVEKKKFILLGFGNVDSLFGLLQFAGKWRSSSSGSELCRDGCTKHFTHLGRGTLLNFFSLFLVCCRLLVLVALQWLTCCKERNIVEGVGFEHFHGGRWIWVGMHLL